MAGYSVKSPTQNELFSQNGEGGEGKQWKPIIGKIRLRGSLIIWQTELIVKPTYHPHLKPRTDKINLYRIWLFWTQMIVKQAYDLVEIVEICCDINTLIELVLFKNTFVSNLQE